MADNPCEAPCWQNITLGQTKKGDVVNLLENIPGVDKSSIEQTSTPIQGYDGAFYWDFQTGEKGIIYTRNGLVASIGLTKLNKITIDDLIKIYGEPQDVMIGGGMNDIYLLGIDLIYPEKEIKAQYFKRSNLQWVLSIKPEDQIENIVYADRQFIQEGLDIGLHFGSNQFNWSGYSDYQCHWK